MPLMWHVCGACLCSASMHTQNFLHTAAEAEVLPENVFCILTVQLSKWEFLKKWIPHLLNIDYHVMHVLSTTNFHHWQRKKNTFLDYIFIVVSFICCYMRAFKKFPACSCVQYRHAKSTEIFIGTLYT
jgi:hypothetical protein